MEAKIIRGRGRPRAFDAEAALAIGQQLFRRQGYAAVGLATLNRSIGIKPPSFYAVFGSKADFFERILARYTNSVLPLDTILRPGREPAEALGDLLQRAAATYADPNAKGCLVLEAARGNDNDESVQLARKFAERRRRQLHDFVATTHTAAAARIVDFISSTMSGLSAAAREGMNADRLLAVASAAARVLPSLLKNARS